MLSLSRAGILAVVFEAGLLALLGTRSGWRAVLSLVVLGVLGTFAIERLWQARAETQTEYTAEDARESRLELWRAGGNMILAHPLLGVGSRRFGEFSRDYGEISHDNRGKNSHNTYIEVLACSGLLGFVPFVAMLTAAFRELRTSSGPHESEHFRAVRLAALCSLCALMFRALSNAKAHEWSIYLLLAVALSCASLRERGLNEDESLEGEAEAEGEPMDAEPGAVPAARPV
jgi:O-antigen ligase